MKKSLFIVVFVILALSLVAIARPGDNQKNRPRYASDLVKIKLSSDAIQRTSLPQGMYAETASFGINELDQLMSRTGGTRIIRAHRELKNKAWEAEHGFDRWFLIRLDGTTSVESAIAAFGANRYIEKAIPEYYAYTTAVPNDTYYANNWGHNNTAQLPVYTGGSHSGAGVGTIGFDSDAQLAWDNTQGYGSASIIIAIIDTGVDTAHPDLRLVAGYDYGDNDSNPMDDSADPGHGTACSGVAAGRANNALGVTGVAGGCSVMPLKIADSAGSLGFTAIENAVTHCGDNNVDVASMSFGAEGGMAEGSSPSTDAAFEYAYSHGVTLLAATANSNTSAIAYPSNHNKVISVGAASPTGQRKSTTSSDGENWWGSNYGNTTMDNPGAVDIMAPTILPATDITGAGGYATGDYSLWFNGTSCATPYAAGVAAVILSKDPSLTPEQVRIAMTSTATDMTFDGGAGWDRYTGYGMVNVNAALNSLIPGMPTCTITAPTSGSVHNLNSTIAVAATATDTDGTITSVQFYVDDVWMNTDNAAPYAWNWNTTGFAGGAHTIKAVATDNASNTAQNSISVTLLAPPDEGFESGNFGAYGWINTSSSAWTVQTADKFSGTYAAKSGTITDNGLTELSITLVASSAGNISFYQKTSSESGYDYLRFYIDNVQQNQWSGSGDWTAQSYAVSSGSHTYKWAYSKDGSVASGSDCAYIDHIIFPPMGTYYAPPTSFTAVPGNGVVTLNWAAPASGTPTGYKIFKNSSLLTTVTGLSYVDNAVVNGTQYSYYLKAVYAGGESDPTATVLATPTNVVTLEAILGNGTSVTGVNDGAPINIYYKSLHGQSVYTQAELNAAGIYGPINLTQLGFYISTLPTLALPNFVIRMKHTTDTNVANWQTSTGMTQVYSNASYMPVAGGYQMLTLTTPFLWNGTNNIVIDTAFGLVATYYSTGTVQYTSVTSGYRFARSDTADQTSIYTGGTVSAMRPNVKMIFAPVASNPQISVSPSSLAFGNVLVGSSSSQNFTITNTGGQTLTGTIVTPLPAYTVAQRSDVRNSIPFSINAGASQGFSLTFAPTAATAYNGNVVITSNSQTDATYNLSVTGAGYNPPTIAVDAEQLTASLLVDEESSDSFTISNTGSLPLNYSISVAEVRSSTGAVIGSLSKSTSDRSITGSTFTVDVTEYTPGTTENWVFTVYNGSTDTEWLEDVYLTFPAGITVNSVSNIVGGTSDMIPDVTSGTGITIHWHGEDGSGWGVIQGNVSGTTTINVTIPSGYSLPLALDYQLNGDVYGAEPHILNGTITLEGGIPPITWISADPISGTIDAGSHAEITGYFSAVGMEAGMYEAVLSITSNDPVTPLETVQILMEVVGGNSAPTIVLPASFSFGIGNDLLVDFAAYINDADADPLTLNYAGNTKISVDISTHDVTFGATPYWYGSEQLTFTVSDGVLQSNDTVLVTVNPPASLLAPLAEVTKTLTGARVSWSAIQHANYYHVYAADTPNGTYTLLGTTQELFLDVNTNLSMKFYMVVSELIPVD